MRWPKLVILIVVVAWPTVAVAAPPEGFVFNTSSQFTIGESASVRVSQIVQLTSKSPRTLERFELKLPFETVEKVRVSYSNGQKIPFQVGKQTARLTGQDFAHTVLGLDLPRQSGSRQHHIRLSYIAPGGFQRLGNGGTLLLPFMNAGLGGSWQAAVNAPKSLPGLNYHPVVTDVAIGAQNRIFSFNSRDIKTPLLGLSFLDAQRYELRFDQQLRGDGLSRSWQTIIVPPELHQQRVYLQDISPQPDKLDVDTDGNVLASYRLWPWQRLDVAVSTRVAVKQLRYDPRKATAKVELRPEFAALIQATHSWPDNDVVSEAAAATRDRPNQWGQVQTLNRLVASTIVLEPSEGRRLPPTVLESKTANALEMSDLLVSLLRAAEIPARQVMGVVLPTSGLYGGQNLHAWVEAYVPGIGWVTLDPAWSRLFNGFGNSPSDRIALAILSGDEAAGYPATELLANVADMQIKPGAPPLPKPSDDSFQLSAARSILLPFLSLDTTEVKNNDGYTADKISLNGQSLGSLAPQENVRLRQFSFGWPQAARLMLHKSETVVAEADIQPVWWPAIVATVILANASVIQFYRLRIRRYQRRRLAIETDHE